MVIRVTNLGRQSVFSARTPVSYMLTSNYNTVDEGSSFTITLETTALTDGTFVPYVITGISSSDISDEPLSGSFVVYNNRAELIINVSNDSLLEGETFQVSLENGQASTTVYINDIFLEPIPTYSFQGNVSSVNEGTLMTVTLTTENVPDNTLVAYNMTGITVDDITGAALTGYFTVLNNTSEINFTIAEDFTTEGSENLLITLDGNLASFEISISDTSTTPVGKVMTRSTSSVNEGQTFNITLTVTGLEVDPTGLQYPYTIYGTGITTGDIELVPMTGNFTLNSSGISVLSFTTTEDNTFESNETFRIELDDYPTVFTSVTIIDTSKPPQTFTLSSTVDGNPVTTVNEGQVLTITLTTENVSNQNITYTITGVTTADIGGVSLTGSFSLVSGVATKTFNITADNLTEGSETFTLTLNAYQESISVTLSDTSQNKINYNSQTITSYSTNYEATTKVAWGGDKFVTATTGAAFISYDGVNWHRQATTASLTHAGSDIAYVSAGTPYFVAVGTGSAISTSPDGITWTVRVAYNSGLNNLTQVASKGSTAVAVGLNGVLRYTTNMTTWTVGSSGVTSNITGIAANGTVFVFVTAGGVIRTSTDGISWITRTSGVTADLSGVAWNGTYFVAVGANGTMTVSSTGTTWTAVTTGITNNFSRIFVANGLLYSVVSSPASKFYRLAAASNPTTFANWVIYYTSSGDALYDGAYSSTLNTYVLKSVSRLWGGSTASGRAHIDAPLSGDMKSNTGIPYRLTSRIVDQWVEAGSSIYPSRTNLMYLTDTTTTYYGINFANTDMVVGSGGRIATGSSMSNLTLQTSGTTTNLFSAASISLSVYVVGGDSGLIRHSTDSGASWVTRTSNVTGRINNIVWNGSIAVAATNLGEITTSTNGSTWTARTSGTTTDIVFLKWFPSHNLFIYGTATGRIATSPDGITWTTRLTASGEVNSIVYDSDSGYLVAIKGVTTYSSLNGTSWSSMSVYGLNGTSPSSVRSGISLSKGGIVIDDGIYTSYARVSSDLTLSVDNYTAYIPVIKDLMHYNSYIYAVTSGGSVIRYNTSGKATYSKYISSSELYSISRSTTTTIVTTSQGTVVSSTIDDTAWTSRTTPYTSNESIRGSVWSGSLSLFVVVGDSGKIATSTAEGITWTQRTSGVTKTLNSVCVKGTGFCAVGRNGTILTSENGTTWVNRSLSGTLKSFNSVAYGENGVLVAVGDGIIASSTDDGATWQVVSSTSRVLRKIIYSNEGDNKKFVVLGSSTLDSITSVSYIYSFPSTGTGSISNLSTFTGSLYAISVIPNLQAAFAGDGSYLLISTI